MAEHIHRFTQALDVWDAPLVPALGRTTTSTPTAPSCARRPTCGSASRPTSCPGARTGWPTCSTAAPGTTWSARSTSCATRRWTSTPTRSWEAGTSGARATPRRSGPRYFETLGEAARSGLFDILAHPDLVKVWGAPRAAARRRPAPLLRARDGRDRRVRRGDRGVHRRAAQAGRRRSTRPARFLEMCLEAGRPVALSSDAHVPEQLGYEYERAVEWLGRRSA